MWEATVTDVPDVSMTIHDALDAVIAVAGGKASMPQRALVATLAHVSDIAADGGLPEPVLRVFIQIVLAAGGEVRVPDRVMGLDLAGYRLEVSDDLAGGGMVFRVRRA
jgi:hypothetical protein